MKKNPLVLACKGLLACEYYLQKKPLGTFAEHAIAGIELGERISNPKIKKVFERIILGSAESSEVSELMNDLSDLCYKFSLYEIGKTAKNYLKCCSSRNIWHKSDRSK